MGAIARVDIPSEVSTKHPAFQTRPLVNDQQIRSNQRMTKNQDISLLTQSLALALLHKGVTEIESDKLSLEFGFMKAWRGFPSRHKLSYFINHDSGNRFYLALPTERKHGVYRARWHEKSSGVLKLRQVEGFTALEDLEWVNRDSGITSQEWVDFAERFLEGHGAQIAHLEKVAAEQEARRARE